MPSSRHQGRGLHSLGSGQTTIFTCSQDGEVMTPSSTSWHSLLHSEKVTNGQKLDNFR